MTTYYLGVDGGGSKTLAYITDETGRIVGTGAAGCGNHQLGVELARTNIDAAVREALTAADLTHADIAYALFGLAGADREADYRILRPLAASLGFERHDVVCDTDIGLRAGTRQPDGVVLICGSGTNSFGINRTGQGYQCGGFGYLYGDFGGGGDLAVEVFRAVIRAWEGREQPTLLTAPVLRILGYTSVEEMYHAYLDHGSRPPRTLAQALFEVEAEDAVAQQILRRQASELALAAGAVIRKLKMAEDTFDVVLVGSILTRGRSPVLFAQLEQDLRLSAPQATLTVLHMEPAAGALLLAMERTGVVVSTEVYEQLEQQLTIKEAATS
ncbi:N-acetylglucosamine kinase [Paenibacillus daejeonensis]|uniref:N-acetylglucosamine kinase n=1 Tax=Paenibacillus daejeonensis TaxID=135193 RepID=UPI000372F7FA|nr:BadF/BadG/BcrA/BcrD ATPase family protein [Paenibacillus daejeonensis]